MNICAMDVYNFIFSEKRGVRFKRHFIFWSCIWVYFAITHASNSYGKREISYFGRPALTFTESIIFILWQLPIVYIMLYGILPHLILKKRYFWAACATLLLWFLGGILNFYLTRDLQPQILSMLLPAEVLQGTQRSEGEIFFLSVMFMSKGVLFVAAIAVAIKFFKHWYLKEQRNLQLQKENTESQLRLLTAQVHPHFLFNTLNNIYSQTQEESPRGSKMIMDLSDILRYILYEGQKPLVPLEQELNMIREYVNLEKVRYGNKLDVHVLAPDKTDHLYIAPLLLLPFVENCFKHGTSKMLQNPWINLTVELKGMTLVMKLMNGKVPLREDIQNQQGIGINNVRQRLELLYKDKYELQIREDEEVFVVDLRVELIRIENKQPPEAIIPSPSTIAYV